MSPWIRLALKEFWLPFHYRKSGCPGGRDFVWLTIFMTLLLTLSLLLLASREGLLNRFVDVLLGNIPGHGVPVAVTNNMLSKGGVNAIDTTVLSEIHALNTKIPGFNAYPYRPLEASLYPLIRLPDDKIWNNRRNDGSKFGPDFDGWAVYPDDPLWRSNDSPYLLPLEIILSRTLFRTYFDDEKYRQTLQNLMPEQFLAALPASLDKNQERPFDTLWMHVTIGMRKELLPFKVIWVNRFPVIDKISYLFPLRTYHALKAAHDFPELRYFPEAYGEGGSRIQQILVEMSSEKDSADATKRCGELAATLNGTVQDYRGEILIAFKQPLPQFWLDAYMAQYHVKYRVIETIPGDKILYNGNEILLPCGRLPNDVLQEAQFDSCADDMTQMVRLDVTAKGNGFQHVLAYIPNRTFLSRAAKALETVKDYALSIHPSYQDALNRFGFLSKMLESLEKPYFWFFVIFLVAFLGIQIGTMIGHHRHRYGILLAKGVEWWQIYAMLWLQIFLSTIIGITVATVGIMTTSLFLKSAVRSVAVSYADTLSITDLNLLPLTYMDYVMVSVTIFCTAILMATFLLHRLPLQHRTHPATLLR